MSIEWKDATAYSQGERGKKAEPRTWEADAEGTIICVTKYRGYEGEWVCHCRALDINTHPLGTTDLETAKFVALGLVGSRALATIEHLNKVVLVLGESS
jgi:hypothetical protein